MNRYQQQTGRDTMECIWTRDTTAEKTHKVTSLSFGNPDAKLEFWQYLNEGIPQGFLTDTYAAIHAAGHYLIGVEQPTLQEIYSCFHMLHILL